METTAIRGPHVCAMAPKMSFTERVSTKAAPEVFPKIGQGAKV